MNERIEHCLYEAGLTAQGCWDKFDEYDKQALNKFAELLLDEVGFYLLENGITNTMEVIEMKKSFL